MIIIEVDEQIVVVKLDDDEHLTVKRLASKQDILERDTYKMIVEAGIRHYKAIMKSF